MIVSAQNDIAAYESATPGYKLLNATVNVSLLPDDSLMLTLRGSFDRFVAFWRLVLGDGDVALAAGDGPASPRPRAARTG